MIWAFLLLVWSVACLAGGAIYGSLHSITVGEKVNRLLLWWDEMVDKLSSLDRRARNKIARAKRLADRL